MIANSRGDSTNWGMEEVKDNNIYSLFGEKMLRDLLLENEDNVKKAKSVNKQNLKCQQTIIDDYDEILK